MNKQDKLRWLAREYGVMVLRELPTDADLQILDTPARVFDYWQANVAGNPYLNPDVECFVVMLLNARRRVTGHQMVSMGTLDTILVHPREVFRLAIMQAASAIVVAHNHPSGDPAPSEADIKVTRDLIKAGQIIKIEVLDHIIVGRQSPERVQPWCSLRELGYFYS